MPKIVDNEQRRRELIEATWKVVAQEGIDAATVRRIAKEVGWSTGLVVHYFRDKDEILLTALQRSCDTVTERMKNYSHLESPLDELCEVILETLPLDEQRVMEWRVWLNFWGHALGNNGLLREQYRRYGAWRVVVNTMLERARRKGEIARDANLSDLSDHIVALTDGIGMQAILEPQRMTPQRVRQVIEAHIASLRKSAGAE